LKAFIEKYALTIKAIGKIDILYLKKAVCDLVNLFSNNATTHHWAKKH
jgi:hypothetical protein